MSELEKLIAWLQLGGHTDEEVETKIEEYVDEKIDDAMWHEGVGQK